MRSETARTTVRVIAVLLAAAAAFISNHLALKHNEANRAATASAPAAAVMSADANFMDKACTAIIPDANCEEVVKSPWGTLWGGIPTARFGLFYFTALFWWFLLIGGVTWSRR